MSKKYKDSFEKILTKIEYYDKLNQNSKNHIHSDQLIYDIKKILWETILEEDPQKRIYYYPTFWQILTNKKKLIEDSNKIFIDKEILRYLLWWANFGFENGDWAEMPDLSFDSKIFRFIKQEYKDIKEGFDHKYLKEKLKKQGS